MKSRSDNYKDWWSQETACSITDGTNVINCSYTLVAGVEAREIYVYSLYTVSEVTSESSTISYLTDYSAGVSHVNEFYGNAMSGYNYNGTSDKFINIDYNDEKTSINKNIVFDATAPVVESVQIVTNSSCSDKTYIIDNNVYISEGCNATFTITIIEANYEELKYYISQHLDKFVLYYGTDFVANIENYAIVTRNVDYGGNTTITENGETINIKQVVVTIDVKAKEPQYIEIKDENKYLKVDDSYHFIDSTKRYNDENGEFANPSGKYLKVGSEYKAISSDNTYLKVGNLYYLLHASNRYNNVSGSYVQNNEGTHLMVSVITLNLDVQNDAIKDYAGHEVDIMTNLIIL